MSEIIVTVKIDKELIDRDLAHKFTNHDNKDSYCDTYEGCRGCPLFYYVNCEESFDAIKKELEK